MKISTKGRYAVEIMVDLAMHLGQTAPESLKSIASRRNLSEKYLERIMKALRQANLVTSMRGAYGGYEIAKPPAEITICEILISVVGELAPVQCLTQETDCKINCGSCPTRNLWEQMWKEIREAAQSITVADVLAGIYTNSGS